MNPYTGNTFFDFFITFITRLFSGFVGGLYNDELQLFVLITIAISGALLGTFLVWRRMAMLANALSHTILAGIVATCLFYFWWQSPTQLQAQRALIAPDILLLIAAILTALVTTFLTQAGVLLFGISEEASTGVVFTFLFALGIALVTGFTKNAHIGSELLMGNVDLVQPRDLQLSFAIMALNCVLVVLFWRPLIVTSLDPVFAHMLGVSIALSGYLLMMQVALTAIGAFRAVGVILFLAFLVAPTITARLWTQSYKIVVLLSCAIGVTSALLGVAFSRHLLSYHGLACSTGALVVTILFLVTIISMILRRVHFPLARRSSSMAS